MPLRAATPQIGSMGTGVGGMATLEALALAVLALYPVRVVTTVTVALSPGASPVTVTSPVLLIVVVDTESAEPLTSAC